MSEINDSLEDAGIDTGPQPSRERMVHSCNFRYAGRLSNENARALTSLHERFALQVTNALQVYLGAALNLKLVSLEQKPTQDYIAGVGANSFLVPCALNVLQSNLLIQMENCLVFPIIDLLLGGVGDGGGNSRELTDIDEEIMESVSILVVREIERTWRSLNLTLSLGRSIKPTAIPQVFPANEKLVLLMFELEVMEVKGLFSLVLPTSFVGFLLRHMKASQSNKLLGLCNLPEPTLRQRMMDCKFQIATDIPMMRVSVKDLVGLTPGTILKLNTPVKTPGKVTVEHTELFEALPVRSGPLKAAQIAIRLNEPSLARE